MRVEANGFVQVLEGSLVRAHVKECNSPVVVGQGQIGIETDGFALVFNGSLVLLQIIEGVAPGEVGVGILRG